MIHLTRYQIHFCSNGDCWITEGDLLSYLMKRWSEHLLWNWSYAMLYIMSYSFWIFECFSMISSVKDLKYRHTYISEWYQHNVRSHYVTWIFFIGNLIFLILNFFCVHFWKKKELSKHDTAYIHILYTITHVYRFNVIDTCKKCSFRLFFNQK